MPRPPPPTDPGPRPPDDEAGFGGLVGSGPCMLELYRAIEDVARLRTTVLVLGESGTGKELVARAIHRRSPTSGEPFIPINCGAFTRSLLEDQLFGHVRGAFTGASADKDGLFVAAGRGTLFLDEIAEIEADLQGRMLRAIQEREVVPLGTNSPVGWQARLIVATNRDLERLVGEGKFRKDLYYRINVVQIRTPPLREHPEDVPALTELFLDRLAAEGGPRKRISPDALEMLVRHPYPGNVRELRNAIERACALGRSAAIEPDDLPKEFRSLQPGGFKPLAEVERDHILRALRLAGGRKSLAARFLAIDRSRLARKLRKYGISVRDAGRDSEADS